MLASRRSVAIAAALVALVGAACGDDDDAGDDGSGRGSDPQAVGGEVAVFAAASLTDAFTEIGDAFTAAHPSVTVTFNFAASSELVAQINEGAPADVFASADRANMQKLVDAGNNGAEPVVFATNALEIVVAAGNPEGITGLTDLSDSELIVVTCAPEVPIGAYSAEVLARAGVTVTPASYEENVRAVVNKVTLGEADAGIVYRSDVVAVGGAAEGVAIPAELNVVAEYPLAVTREAPNAPAGRAFVDFVSSGPAQAILARHGFSAP